MEHTGRHNRTLMGEEWVCRYCYQGYIAIHVGDTVRWPVAEQWAHQNAAYFQAHQCEGELAERAAKKIKEALWRQEHAKRIRRRV